MAKSKRARQGRRNGAGDAARKDAARIDATRSNDAARAEAGGPLAPRVVVLVDTATGWGRAIIRGISTYSRHHGPWHLWVEPHGQAESMRPPRTWAGEGIIARVSTPQMARQLKSYGVPIVNVSGIPLDGHDFPRVTHDLTASADLAADYFYQRGFRSYAYVGWTKFAHVEQHYRAFADNVRRRGHDCPHFQLGVRNSSAAGWRKQQSELARWLAALPKPVAVLTWAQQGLAVLDACSWGQLSVPEQVAVLSGDDDETLYPACTPPLSGIAQASERIGSLAAETLATLMAGGRPAQPVTYVPPTHVNERVSTDTLAVTDAEVAAAVRFIRDHAVRGIQVDDVAEQVAMSRRSLERRFVATLGHSPADEIRRVRLAHALMLLATSTLPIPIVAEKSGFGSGMYLAQVMRQEQGMTPLRYRNAMRSSQQAKPADGK